jgi:hypothetical protein
MGCIASKKLPTEPTKAALDPETVVLAARAPADAPRHFRVLVTGFCDWEGLQNKRDGVWRSRDNPSSRLLLGAACDSPPFSREGALAARLRASNLPVEWGFMALPTHWCTARVIDYMFWDVVVHMGLGVYDNHNTLLLEKGAFNSRSNHPDAAGNPPPAPQLCEGAPLVLEAPPHVAAAIASAAALALPGGFRVEVAAARSDNAYICNETNWRALEAVAAAAVTSKPKPSLAAYFLHLPQPAEPDDFAQLADAVEAVVTHLVRESVREHTRAHARAL